MLSLFYMISSSSWMGVWLAMELNLYTFILMLMLSPNSALPSQPANSAMVYFIVQAISSWLLILALILMYSNTQFPMPIPQTLLLMSLLMKLGATPFHFWIPWMVNNSTWPNTFWFLSMQKLPPLLILHNIFNLLNNYQESSFFSYSLIFTIILSALFGGLLGLNQTRLQPLLAYSSINQTAWLIFSSTTSFPFMMTYFSFYSLTLLAICLLMQKTPTLAQSQPHPYLPLAPAHYHTFMMLILVLSGMPPSIMFFLKLNVFLLTLSCPFFLVIILPLIVSSLLTMFYYLQFTVSMTLPPKYYTKHPSPNRPALLTALPAAILL
uniref:NADH-ubiquinone oxidoreductase chain 2 n=1 Tax=Phyllochaetopterus sp. AW-2015 TaxID=1750699 RepID=A0A0S2N0J4_9ANNE|nr:NADH dehydrogenase subunit 2 [Phyllochaetopterus sp. AW-2015]